MRQIELGQKVACKVTGFSGIVTARIEYLNGCIRYEVQPPIDKDKKIPESAWIDQAQLTVKGRGIEVTKLGTEGPASNEPPQGL